MVMDGALDSGTVSSGVPVGVFALVFSSSEAASLNSALALLFVFIVKVQSPLPLQSPLHSLNS